ncbi:MAG: hypothetical protein J5766_00490 [Clostridia bacterium]|nr:hypothetical protein [Clostridia bacterium]
MKKTFRITLCAICSALSFVVILLGYFPYFTYAAPAVAGLFVMIPVIETGLTYAFATYLTSAVLVTLFAEPETKVLFLVLFGFYPIIKSIFEKIPNRILEWVLKLTTFTSSIVVSYLIFKYLTDIDVNDFGPLGKYGAGVFLVLCYIAFVLYDLAISQISSFYFARIRPKLDGLKK